MKRTYITNYKFKKFSNEVNCSKLCFNKELVKELKGKFIAFDTETTGLDPNNDYIIEIGAIVFENGEVVDEFNTLINPLIPIPYSISLINNITDEMLIDSPTEEVAIANFVSFLGKACDKETIIVGHNALFDMKFLSNSLIRLGYSSSFDFIDTLELGRTYIKGVINHKQGTLAEHFNIINKKAHRASSDALTCGKILLEIIKIFESNRGKYL